jgi:hypothetical protein
MAKNVHNYLDKIDALKDAVIEDKDSILEDIDLDLLLNDPETYLEAKAGLFLKKHLPKIKQARKAGEQYAKKVI